MIHKHKRAKKDYKPGLFNEVCNGQTKNLEAELTVHILCFSASQCMSDSSTQATECVDYSHI